MRPDIQLNKYPKFNDRRSFSLHATTQHSSVSASEPCNVTVWYTVYFVVTILATFTLELRNFYDVSY